MSRTYDQDRPVNIHLSPVQIAKLRSEMMRTRTDRDPAATAVQVNTFVTSFAYGRDAALSDDDGYSIFRAALDDGASYVVAGLIEGLASTRGTQGMVK